MRLKKGRSEKGGEFHRAKRKEPKGRMTRKEELRTIDDREEGGECKRKSTWTPRTPKEKG